MEITKIAKAIKKDTTISDGCIKKPRVAAYIRVSTDSSEQINSFDSQYKYYANKIKNNPNWEFAGIYSDEGISGTRTTTRNGFLKMIIDSERNKMDIIITKSISRFARNTLDTLKYVRELKSHGVAIIFEEENINTLDMAGELLLTVLSSVAQQESETISSHIKLGLKMKKERGELVGFSSCYGLHYDSKTHKMSVIEEEAKVVKYIFEQYLKGYGCSMISQMLTNMNIISPGGHSSWSPTTIVQILRQEKYVGDVIQGKTYTVDSITHKREVNNGEEDKYIIKDHHEPIVSREVFEEAQMILSNRSISIMTGRKRISAQSFTGRMRCGLCGNTYTRRKGHNCIHWACTTCVKGNKVLCPNSKILPDEIIRNTFMESYYLLTANDGLALEEFMDTIRDVIHNTAPDVMSARYEDERRKHKAKLNKLVDLYVDGDVDRVVYEKKRKNLEYKINELTEKIDALAKYTNNDSKIEINLNKIRNSLKAREASNQIEEFDKIIFDSLVDYVIIGGMDENEEPNGFIIRYICKTGIYNKSRTDISETLILENGLNNTNDNIYVPILDFLSNQKFFTYEYVNGKRAKKYIDKVRVRLEIEK